MKFEVNEPRKIFKDITKNIFLNEEVENYEKNRLKTEAIIIDHVTVNPLYIFKGKIYSAYLFNVVARENIDSLNEKLFLNLDLKNKRAIAIKNKKLLKNQSTQVIIIVGN